MTNIVRKAVIAAHLGNGAVARQVVQQMIFELGIGHDEDGVTTASLTGLLEAAVLAEDRDAAVLLERRLAPASFMSTAYTAMTCPAPAI